MMGWQVGDLAVCVDARKNPFYRETSPLIEGRIYRVVGLAGPAHSRFYNRTVPLPGLIIQGVPAKASSGWAQERFRKILPDKHEACEEEFVTLLNRAKRTVKA